MNLVSIIIFTVVMVLLFLDFLYVKKHGISECGSCGGHCGGGCTSLGGEESGHTEYNGGCSGHCASCAYHAKELAFEKKEK